MKIKISTFILSVLLAIACIVIIVMGIINEANDNLERSKLANNITDEIIDSKYAIEKSITLKNKEYKISIEEDSVYEDEFDGTTYRNFTSKIYLNDKEIGQYKNTSIPKSKITGKYNYSNMIRLDYIRGKQNEEEYVIVTYNQPTLLGDNIYYIILDSNGGVIVNVHANKIKDIRIRTEDGIIGPENSWKLGENYIVFYDKTNELTGKSIAAKYLLTVEKGKVNVKLLRYYGESEIIKDI